MAIESLRDISRSGVSAFAGGGGGFTESATAPSSPSYGDRWLDTTSGIEYTWVNPGVWVDLSEPSAADVAAAIHAATGKTTPVDADELGLSDSADSWSLKHLTFANLKAWIAGLFVGKTGVQVMAGDLTVPSLNGGQLAGHRNKIINGDFSQNGRAATSVADDAYCLDRWYVLTESGSVTVGQLTDPEVGSTFGIRLTQPDVSAKRIGIAQIIESNNIRQFAGVAMNLSARLRLSTGANIRYAVIEHTGTADSVTSDVVSNWASTTYTASNFFISGINIISTGTIAPGAATWGGISDSDTLGASVKNVIVFFWTESTVAQGVTLDVSRVQYEPGAVETPFEWRHNEAQLCYRYFKKSAALPATMITTTAGTALLDASASEMRSTPTIALIATTNMLLDPSVSLRNLSTATPGAPHYVDFTCAATTANKLHIVFAGAFSYTSEL